MANKEPEPNDVFKYLGFDVHPGQIGEFWTSEDEKQRYLQGVKDRGGQTSVLDREQALLNIKLMNPVDKIISTIGSIILIISFFLPAYSFDLQGTHVSGIALLFFVNLPVAGGYASWGGPVIMLSLFLYALILLACPMAGVLNLIGLYNKKQGDDYFDTLKKYHRYSYIPMGLFVLLFIVLVIGAPQPFGSLGVDAFGESFNIAAIFNMAGLGFWVNIAGLAIGFAQSRGL
jgi:hypothetical protein